MSGPLAGHVALHEPSGMAPPGGRLSHTVYHHVCRLS
jgi:hypothetical protein